MGRLAQAATDQAPSPNSQALQHRQGRAGPARHTLGQQQRLGRVPAPPPVPPPLQQGRHPIWIQGLAAAEAAGGAGTFQAGEAQVGHGGSYRAAQIHHPGALQQAQLPQHHMADQGWAHPGRQLGQGVATAAARPLQQQLGIGRRRAESGLGGGAGGRDPWHRGRVGGGQQHQGAGGPPALMPALPPGPGPWVGGHGPAQRGSRATRARRDWGGSLIGACRRANIQ